jgi:hypothetical protein
MGNGANPGLPLLVQAETTSANKDIVSFPDIVTFPFLRQG